MPGYSLGHVQDDVLLRDLASIVATDRSTTARMLAHLAEVRSRRLYAKAGYSSMYHYCLGEFGFSEDMAGKRVTAARLARRFPRIYEAIAHGRLHVTALCLLSKPLRGLTGEEAHGLIAAAEHKTNDQIRLLLAERFPQPDLAPRIRPVRAADAGPPVEEQAEVLDLSGESAPERVDPTEESRGGHAEPAAKVAQTQPDRAAPLSPGRFGLQLTMSAETHEKLSRAQELLGHTVDRGDLASVLDRALDALIEKLERRRFAVTERPRVVRPTRSPDHIPAAVKRAVMARDHGRCTFQSENGRNCEERSDLEYDHVIPRSRGGKSTVDNLRLRCFAHNQLEAERMFGAGFMELKRAAARLERPRSA